MSVAFVLLSWGLPALRGGTRGSSLLFSAAFSVDFNLEIESFSFVRDRGTSVRSVPLIPNDPFPLTHFQRQNIENHWNNYACNIK